MKHRFRSWLLPVIFCMILLSFSVLLLTGEDRSYSEREKRYLSAAPQFTAQSLLDGTYRDALEQWVEDQFPGRDLWVGVHAYANYLLGRNTTNAIYLAKDGYLINAPVFDDFSRFEAAVERFDLFAEQTGLPASFVMIPSTGWLKEEILPPGHGEYPDDEMFQRAEELVSYIRCVDLRDNLCEADEVDQTAYRTDHHLTSFGNYAVYKGWREAFGKTVRSASDYEIEVFPGFYGTTWSGSGYWLTKPDDVELWDSGAQVQVSVWDGEEERTGGAVFFREHLKEIDKYPVFLDGNHALTTVVNPSGTEGNLLVIKDSYAHGFVPFLAEHYGTIYMIDLRYYRGNISEFVSLNGVDEILFLYGTTTLLTDSNSAWLF